MSFARYFFICVHRGKPGGPHYDTRPRSVKNVIFAVLSIVWWNAFQIKWQTNQLKSTLTILGSVCSLVVVTCTNKKTNKCNRCTTGWAAGNASLLTLLTASWECISGRDLAARGVSARARAARGYRRHFVVWCCGSSSCSVHGFSERVWLDVLLFFAAWPWADGVWLHDSMLEPNNAYRFVPHLCYCCNFFRCSSVSSDSGTHSVCQALANVREVLIKRSECWVYFSL